MSDHPTYLHVFAKSDENMHFFRSEPVRNFVMGLCYSILNDVSDIDPIILIICTYVQVVNAIHGVFRNGYFSSIYTLMNVNSWSMITMETMDLIV